MKTIQLFHERVARFHFFVNATNQRQRVHEEFANWIEFDPNKFVVRVNVRSLEVAQRVIRYQVLQVKTRPSRLEPGKIRVHLTLKQNERYSTSQPFQLGFLVSANEAFELIVESANKESLSEAMMTALNAQAINAAVELGLPEAAELIAKINPEALRVAMDMADATGCPLRDVLVPRIKPHTVVKDDYDFDEPWRYSGRQGWKKRKIKNGRPTTGTYVVVNFGGQLPQYEFESRTDARNTAVKLAGRDSSAYTVLYVSGAAVGNGVQWIERETSRRD